MKSFLKMPLIAAAVVAGVFALSACASTQTTVSQEAPAEYVGPVTESGRTLIQQMQWNSPTARQDIVFMVGEFRDETGDHLDAETLRYSTAVTQAADDIVTNNLRNAGFQVAERNPYNMGLIAQEWQLSHQFVADPSGQPASNRNVGLIQHNGPSGGLVGANYLVTGSITSYTSSQQTGGGGADVDSIGFSLRHSEAKVGVTLRIVEVSSGLVVSSMYLESTIRGETRNFHITRFFGDVASTVATVTGGASAATILRPQSGAHIVSAEFGSSQQLPIDYGVMDALAANLARQFEVNHSRFYTAPVSFDYNVASH